MAMPTEEQLQAMKINAENLARLTTEQLICLALAELVAVMDEIPVGKRLPLSSVLQIRSGLRDYETGGGV